MNPSTKICTKCGIEKELDQFHKNKGYRLGVTAQCKKCRNEVIKAWQQNNPAKMKAAFRRYSKTAKYRALQKRARDRRRPQRLQEMKHWHEMHPGKNLEYNLNRALKANGISKEWYLVLLERQNNGCAICHREPKGDLRYAKGRLCIDHRHTDGTVRGLLCDKCNFVIGYSQESPVILRKAAEYLERHQ